MAQIRTVATIAVIGAGAAGRVIAHRAVLGGYRTILEDILPASLRKAESDIRGSLEQAIEQGRISRAQAEAALLRLEYVGTVEAAAREADLVIEAVPDEMESKLEIFTLLDRICRPNTILCSTTTSLSVTEIASITYRGKMIVGLGFPGGATSSNRLEITRGEETDDETVAACVEFGRRMGMEVVEIAG
jgi:3-hydroxybutyryl-CoA dehydrogenase